MIDVADFKYLYTISDEVIDGKPGKAFGYVRELPTDEAAAIQAGQSLLRDMTEGHPLMDVFAAEAGFRAAVDALANATSKRESLVPEVQRAFKYWLGSLRSFDDRTCAWITRRLGKSHPAIGAFRAALRGEYDNNFAYRLSYVLRNKSEHVAAVINDLGFRAVVEPSEDVTTRPVIRIQGPKLVSQIPGLKAGVRDELRGAFRPIEVAQIVEAGSASCERSYMALVAELWDGHLEPAVSRCRSLHEEALEHDGDWAMFTDQRYLVAGSRVETQHNFFEMAERLTDAYELTTMPAKPVVLTLQDFFG